MKLKLTRHIFAIDFERDRSGGDPEFIQISIGFFTTTCQVVGKVLNLNKLNGKQNQKKTAVFETKGPNSTLSLYGPMSRESLGGQGCLYFCNFYLGNFELHLFSTLMPMSTKRRYLIG